MGRSLPESFVRDLTSIMYRKSCNNDDGKSVMSAMIQIADNQVDPSICKCIIDGEADAILSEDSDFTMHLGNNHFDVMTKNIVVDRKEMSIKRAKVVTGQKVAASWIEFILVTHVKGKLVFPLTHRKGKNNAELSTYDHVPKHPCLNEVKDINIRTILVLIAGCDTLASVLIKGVGSKLCYEIVRDITGAAINERIKSFMGLIVKETKPKLVTVED